MTDFECSKNDVSSSEKIETISKVFILKEHTQFWDTGLSHCKNYASVCGIKGRRHEDPGTAFKQTTSMAMDSFF